MKTTGELREVLAKMIEQVRDGSIDLDKARTAAKLAAQINESFHAEARIGAAKIGLTQLGGSL